MYTLNSSLTYDWGGNCGIPGGIPTDRTQYGDTLTTANSLAEINAAIQAASSGQYVQLAAGNYSLGQITFGAKSGVTLRGAGPGQTVITSTATRAVVNTEDYFRDADGIDKVRRAIENAGDATVIDIYLESENGKERHRFPRLFKNCPEINWCGSIHNYLNKVADKWEDIVITYGYSPTHGTDPDRSLRLLEQAVIDEPKSSRNWYYLGREYQYKHRWAASEVALRKALDMSRWSPEIADSRFLMARALWNLQRGNEAREECLKAIGVNPNFKEALLFMGDMCYPGSRSAWHRYAGTATNEGLLFVRVK